MLTTQDTSYISQTIIDLENLDTGGPLINNCRYLDGFTIQNSNTANGQNALYSSNHTTYKNLVVQNNYGCPIYSSASDLHIYDSIIRNNQVNNPILFCK